jgi:hypothetical protein
MGFTTAFGRFETRFGAVLGEPCFERAAFVFVLGFRAAGFFFLFTLGEAFLAAFLAEPALFFVVAAFARPRSGAFFFALALVFAIRAQHRFTRPKNGIAIHIDAVRTSASGMV